MRPFILGLLTALAGCDSRTVSNTPPVAATRSGLAVFEWQNAPCVVGVQDADGDPLTVTYSWTIDGVPHAEPGSVLSHEACAPGSTLRCTATIDDGTDTATVSSLLHVLKGSEHAREDCEHLGVDGHALLDCHTPLCLPPQVG
jgi:hypothetical protein